MKKVPDYILVRSKWVLCNKGDAADPDVRAHLVACEVNKKTARTRSKTESKKMCIKRSTKTYKKLYLLHPSCQPPALEAYFLQTWARRCYGKKRTRNYNNKKVKNVGTREVPLLKRRPGGLQVVPALQLSRLGKPP